MGKRESQSALDRKIHMVAKDEIGLSDEERFALATFLLRRDIRSWKELDPAQAFRIADALEGYQLISELLRQRVQ